MSLCSVWLSWGRSWQQSSAGRRHFSYTSCLTRRSSQPAAGKSTARSKRQFQPRRNTNLPTPDKLNPFLPSTWEPRAAFALQPHQDPLDLVATYAIALAQPDSPVISTLAQTLGLPVNELEHLAQRWKQETSFGSSIPENFSRIKHLAVSEGLLAIHQAVLQHFLAWSIRSTHASVTTRAALQRLHNHTNYTRPESWRPLARRYHRKVILHVGPTNSGKTHQALAALAQARTGVYAGPLRLLAHEVYTRFNKGNIGGLIRPRACNLVTGEEQRIVAPISATETILSCTVEMIPHNKLFDVVVIDEIQMIADTDRGDAWTNAFLNVHANEIHLCGEERAVHLIERLAELTGDEVEVRRYQRLSGLEVSTKSLRGDLSKVERGDCIVTFSRNNIFALKQAVEKQTNLKVVVAYGGLPPEVREEQARIFNEEAGADVMIASDAIGMGLNLYAFRLCDVDPI